eukprot:gene35788-40484_t
MVTATFRFYEELNDFLPPERRRRAFDAPCARAATVKHTEPGIWKELRTVAIAAHEDWKRAHPGKVLGDGRFYMLAEVYNYNIAHGKQFDMGGGAMTDFYDNGFDGMINFGLVCDAEQDEEYLLNKV